VIAQLGDIELVHADAGAERGDQRAYFRRAQHLVEPRPFDVEDLAPERQNRLEPPVAALFGRAAGRIALDDKYFRERRVTLLAVGQFAGQRGDIERPLAPGQLTRLARRLARRRGLDHLGDHAPRLVRVLLEVLAQAVVDQRLDHRPDLGGHQLVLGLARKLGVGHLDREHAGQPLARVLAAERHPLALGDARGDRIGVDLPRQRGAEAGQVGAAVALRDVVGEAEHGLVIAVGPLQRGLDDDAVTLAVDRHRRLDQRVLGAVEVTDEGFEPALVV